MAHEVFLSVSIKQMEKHDAHITAFLVATSFQIFHELPEHSDPLEIANPAAANQICPDSKEETLKR